LTSRLPVVDDVELLPRTDAPRFAINGEAPPFSAVTNRVFA
jgi:hypothetical protein